MITEFVGTHDPYGGKDTKTADVDPRTIVLRERYAEYRRALSLRLNTRRVDTALLSPVHETYVPNTGAYKGKGTPG